MFIFCMPSMAACRVVLLAPTLRRFFKLVMTMEPPGVLLLSFTLQADLLGDNGIRKSLLTLSMGVQSTPHLCRITKAILSLPNQPTSARPGRSSLQMQPTLGPTNPFWLCVGRMYSWFTIMLKLYGEPTPMMVARVSLR